MQRIAAPSDHTLELDLGDARDEVLRPIHDHARRRLPRGTVECKLVEQSPAHCVRERPGRGAVHMKDVEDLEHRQVPLSGCAG